MHKRLLKHKSKNKFDISKIDILEKLNSLTDALNKELEFELETKSKNLPKTIIFIIPVLIWKYNVKTA